MGLLSKVKKTVGNAIKKTGTALGGMTKGAKSGMATKVLGVAKFGAKAIPTLRVASAALTIGAVGKKLLTGKKTSTTGTAQKKKSLLSKVATATKYAVAGAGGLYLAEQVAEKLGVRGGAGFIGRRKRKGKRRSKYMTIRVPRNRRGEGSISKTEEKRLRRAARNASFSDGVSRRSRRKRKGKSMKNYMKWVRSHRRKK
jgi:hypothetical protein